MVMGLSPRVRGNHVLSGYTFLCRFLTAGLSPRVRGNLSCQEMASGFTEDGVYPRVCGGTVLGPMDNLGARYDGSIPACAGEPS